MTSSGTFLATCLAELGYVEGARNYNRYADEAGHANYQPWCATYLVAMARRAGLSLPPGTSSAYTPAMLSAFRRAELEVAHPRPGDWGFVYYRAMRRIGHVFTVVEVLDDDTVLTAEGNTDQALSRTGGRVASLIRSYGSREGSGYVAAFVRPTYELGGPIVQGSVLPAALANPTGSAVGPDLLLVDGALGPLTISRWQAVAGTTIDGFISRPSELIAAVQRTLAQRGHDLGTGGVDGRLGPATIRALQRDLGTPVDGVISTPRSSMVEALQQRLNVGRF